MQQRSGVEFWSWKRVHKTVFRKFGIPCQAYSTREVSCLWHVQGRKLSCLLTFLSGSLLRGFLRVHRITSTITRVYTNLTTDSKWPVDMTKCNCSDHCSITRPLEGWASAASWSPAMAKGALASGLLRVWGKDFSEIMKSKRWELISVMLGMFVRSVGEVRFEGGPKVLELSSFRSRSVQRAAMPKAPQRIVLGFESLWIDSSSEMFLVSNLSMCQCMSNYRFRFQGSQSLRIF